MTAASSQGLSRYLKHLRAERRLSPHTLGAYRRDLEKLLAFAQAHAVTDFSVFNVHHARAFAADLRRAGLSGRSIRRALSAARGLYRYLQREKLAACNPFAGVIAPKAGHRLPRTLSVDQVSLLLSVKAEKPLAIRDLAIMELMYSSGLRLSELANLDLAELDLRDDLVRVTGKGGKTRVVPVGRFAHSAVNAWLSQRASIVAQAERAVFVSRHGRRLSPRSIQARIAYWAKVQGLDVRVSPHMLRHSFASHLLESSGELRVVQELLGHANVSTTQVYTHLDFQQLAKVYDRAHPRARKRG